MLVLVFSLVNNAISTVAFIKLHTGHKKL